MESIREWDYNICSERRGTIVRPLSKCFRVEPVSNASSFSFFLFHKIWMLFISPADPAFSAQTPSNLSLAKKEEKLQKYIWQAFL